MPGDSCHHARPYFFPVMERKNIIRPILPRQGFMRTTGLPFDCPADFQQGSQQADSFN